ncbi:hypothetical protein BASA61_002314 [Batrachochytrium salamandrivorans]|nr:hypothetical protein BASA61_002314 [Batrachochytrium salamandrivorans]
METISLFVHYLYTDTLLTASPRMYADTMVMANRYCLWRLQRLCSAAILATPSDMDSLWVFICATKTHELLLRERSLKYILANFGMISKCPDFGHSRQPISTNSGMRCLTLQSLLSIKSLHLASSESVF